MRLLRLACLVLLLAPATAVGQTRTVETGSRTPLAGFSQGPHLDGPFLAGDELIWSEQRQDGQRVVVADGPAGRREIDRRPAGEWRDALDVAEGRVALARHIVACPPTDDLDDPCSRYNGQYPLKFELLTGPVAGPLTPLAAGCGATGALVSADAVLLLCYSDPTRTVASDGTVREYEDAGWSASAIAGDVLALRRRGGDLVVLRRSSGEELLRVPGLEASAGDVAADGTVAYVYGGSQRPKKVGWSSPADPRVHELAVGPDALDVRIAAGRVAVRASAPGGLRFVVAELDGRVVADHVVGQTTGGWDFDGRRLAWARRPCSRSFATVWDLADPPPPAPGTRCTLPEVATRSARVRARRLRLEHVCPATADAGCAASSTVALKTRRGRRVGIDYLPSTVADRDPGERWTETLRLSRRQLRAVRRAREAWLVVELQLPLIDPRRRRVAVRG